MLASKGLSDRCPSQHSTFLAELVPTTCQVRSDFLPGSSGQAGTEQVSPACRGCGEESPHHGEQHVIPIQGPGILRASAACAVPCSVGMTQVRPF